MICNKNSKHHTIQLKKDNLIKYCNFQIENVSESKFFQRFSTLLSKISKVGYTGNKNNSCTLRNSKFNNGGGNGGRGGSLLIPPGEDPAPVMPLIW